MPGPIELPAPPRRWPIAIAVAVLAVAIAITAVVLTVHEPVEPAPADAPPVVIDTAPVPRPITAVVIGTIGGPDLGEPLRQDIRSQLRRALRVAAPDLRVVMEASELAGDRAVYVDANVRPLRPAATDVPCSIQVLVATYPEMAIGGFADGKARGRDASDCLRQAIDQVVAAKIVPLIRTRLRML
jgi:hypothetical protein